MFFGRSYPKAMRTAGVLLLLFAAMLALSACAQRSQPPIAIRSEETAKLPTMRIEVVKAESAFVFAWMSDTQYYSEKYSDIYKRMTQWLADNRKKLNIRYVFHTGDITNSASKSAQWKNAGSAMAKLDGVIPYGVLAGNHDVGTQNIDYQYYSANFGTNRFEKRAHFGAAYKNNRGHYDLITTGGMSFIMVYMGWGVDDEGIAWMNQVLGEHKDRIAFLAFHNYLTVDNMRDETGQMIFEKVVVPNRNVRFVLCGHNHGVALLKDRLDDDGDGISDRTVYQMMADYQAMEKGGGGYMRLLTLTPKTQTLLVQTYSPYTDEHNPMGESDTFTLPLP